MAKTQKVTISILLFIAIGAALYETKQARNVRTETKNLQAQQANLPGQISNLQANLASLTNQLAVLLAENERLKTNSGQTEVLKLRSEATRLRPLQDDVATLQIMLKQSSAGLPKWKTNELADAGRASPIDALKTYIYLSQIDPAKLQTGVVGNDVDPPSEDTLQNFIQNKNNYPGAIQGNWHIQGYKIVSQTWLASDKVQVELETEGRGGIGLLFPFTLRKVNGEWKLVVFNIRGKHGATGQLGFTEEAP
jgi:hypothetical protein